MFKCNISWDCKKIQLQFISGYCVLKILDIQNRIRNHCYDIYKCYDIYILNVEYVYTLYDIGGDNLTFLRELLSYYQKIIKSTNILIQKIKLKNTKA